MCSARRISEIRGIEGDPARQRGYYEHIVRNEGELGKIREYIVTNPSLWITDPEKVRAGL